MIDKRERKKERERQIENKIASSLQIQSLPGLVVFRKLQSDAVKPDVYHYPYVCYIRERETKRERNKERERERVCLPNKIDR